MKRSDTHIWIEYSPAYRIGRVMRVVGLLMDCGIGIAVLADGSARLLLLHPLAVIVWMQGICLMDGYSLHDLLHARQHAARADEEPSEASMTPGWGKKLAIGLVALGLFPGFGPLGWSIACALAPRPSRSLAWRTLIPAELDNPLAVTLSAEADNPWAAIAVQPMVDVLREPDPALRHAAIRILGTQPNRESVRMLRMLLVDPDPDVRSEASATLFRFENQLNRTLAAALARVRDEPDSADHYIELAARYCHYTECDLLDLSSMRLYIERAVRALERAAVLMPARPDIWLTLARVRYDSGEMAAATAALDHAVALSPGDRQVTLFQMEIAFREQQWCTLTDLSQEESSHITDLPVARELLHWWRRDTTGTVARPHAGAMPQLAYEG